MADDSFKTVDVARAREALDKLHEQIVGARGRVEIRRDGCDECCVLISKAELECLEQALEILAGSDEFRAMEVKIGELAALTMGAEFRENVSS